MMMILRQVLGGFWVGGRGGQRDVAVGNGGPRGCEPGSGRGEMVPRPSSRWFPTAW
jgi:hypothetical protein